MLAMLTKLAMLAMLGTWCFASITTYKFNCSTTSLFIPTSWFGAANQDQRGKT